MGKKISENIIFYQYLSSKRIIQVKTILKILIYLILFLSLKNVNVLFMYSMQYLVKYDL